MGSLKTYVSVLVLAAFPCLSLAAVVEECSEEAEGFEKAECYLEKNLIDRYFEYASSYYIGAKEVDGSYDPAFGFRLMESVVRHEKPEYAELATEVYYWGLNADEVKPFQKLVEREVRYLSVLLTPDEQDEFNEMLDKGDSKIYEMIRRFWKSRDVVASSDKNERLLEHWERIIYSQENFAENDSTVFGTDERGIIYVRLGEPNRIRTGRFGSSAAEVRTKLYDLQAGGFISGSSSALHNMQQEIMTSVIPADYELWHYNDIGESERERLFFLFGREEGSGSYGLRRSVEEFIPQEVFSRSLGQRSIGADIRIGNFLQFMYYSDLASVHMFFGNRLNEYDRAWQEAIRGNRINAGYLRNNISRQRARAATEDIYDAAPDDMSMYERQLQGFDMEVLEYRFLDEEGSPELVYIVNSSPYKLFEDYGFIAGGLADASNVGMVDAPGQEIRESEFNMQLRQGVSHFDHDFARVGRTMYQYSDDFLTTMGEELPSNTSHSIAITANLDNYGVAFSELYYRLHGSENPDSWSLIGVNRIEPRHIPILEFESGELVLSDLVLGSTARDRTNIRGQSIGILENGYKINEGDDLQVYVEIYHFEQADRGYSDYEVVYQIESSGRSWWPFSSSTEQSLTWEATAEDWFDYQFFEVEASDREPGNYELHLEITETETGRQTTRSVEFEVLERSDNDEG